MKISIKEFIHIDEVVDVYFSYLLPSLEAGKDITEILCRLISALARKHKIKMRDIDSFHEEFLASVFFVNMRTYDLKLVNRVMYTKILNGLSLLAP